VIIRPTSLDGCKNIYIGRNVIVSHCGWLAAVPHTGNNACTLNIGDGTYIGRFCHIYSTSNITIGKKVLIADKVYISDNTHEYKDAGVPVINQPVVQIKEVHIGDGAWLGENVCVIGASIGENSVVAANAVVTKDIPAYCVAAGIPAKIIKKYNFDLNNWQNTNAEGEFI
jgi:acetyltransferase-like isoleucine patch superfamily enzyme